MEGILERIESNRESFTAKEQAVAEAVLSDPSAVLTRSITSYASHIGTSAATITRFCKRLEMSGFPELKIGLGKEIGAMGIGQISSSPSQVDVIDEVFANLSSSLAQLRSLLDEESLLKAVSLVTNARRVVLCGVGASGIVAKDFHQKLGRIGIVSLCDDDFDLVKVHIASCDSRDVLVAFSYSGTKSVVRSIIKQAHERGVKVVTVTKAGNNPVSVLADVRLSVAASEAVVRNGATVSRLQMLVLVDILYQMMLSSSSAFSVLMETWKSVQGGGR